jgi:hypothetical protein
VSGGLTAGEVWSVQAFSSTELICTVEDSSSAGTLWYSSDAGATWTQATATLNTPGRITVATSPASATQAWGMYEDTATGNIERGLLKTTDKGHTWSFVAAPTVSGGLFQGIGGSMSSDGGQGFYNHGIAVDPANINNVFLGANLALYRTLDGGATWAQMTHWYGDRHVYAHADYHCTRWSQTGPSTLFIGNDGGLCIVRDPFRASIPTGSSTVASDPTFIDNRRNKGLVTHLVYNVGSTTAATPTGAQYEISLGMQDNGTRIRQGSGAALQTSSIFDDMIGGDGFGTLIQQADGTKMLGSYYYDQIQRSTDGGATFTGASSGISESGNSGTAPFQTRLALGSTSTPDTVYTATNGKIYQSTNWATSWSAMGTTGLPPGGTNSASDPSNALYIRNFEASTSNGSVVGIAANQGRVFTTINGGTSWVAGGALPNNASYTSCIHFDTTDPQIIYVGSVAPSTTAYHLWKSTNGGASFNSIDTNGFPTGIPVHVIKNDPTNHNALYAGTDFGVYRSTDGGSTWARFGTGLPLVATRDLYIAADGSFLRAATFGRGVWEISLATSSVVTISPNSTSLSLGTNTAFKAYSSLSPNTVTWTTTGGTMSPTTTAGDNIASSSFTPPAAISGVSQDFTITATGSDGVTVGTATATVYDPASVTVSISPSTPQTVLVGGTLPFTATTNFGSVNWFSSSGGSYLAPSITPGDGTTKAILHPPPFPGDLVVTAQSVGTASQSVIVHVKTLDLNTDGVVDVFDLLNFAADYGAAGGPADFDGSGTVDDADLNLLLAGIQ